MKQARLIWIALAVLVVAGTAALALAGGKSAHAPAAATAKACTADMAAQCTAGMAATCATKSAAAAGGSSCAMHGAAAASAKGGQCPYMSGAKGAACDPKTCPPGMCQSKGARAAAANDCCATHGTAAAGSGAAHGTTRMAAAVDCDACADMAACQSDIAEAGGKVQVVPLKNGLMYVYSAESSARVRAVQAAVARHAERVAALSAAVDKVHLCSDCREMRGAAASGKLTREVVNIENGCLTLVTSNDPHVVARLYEIAGVPTSAARANTKS